MSEKTLSPHGRKPASKFTRVLSTIAAMSLIGGMLVAVENNTQEANAVSSFETACSTAGGLKGTNAAGQSTCAFPYKGSEYSFNFYKGKFKLEVWGAQGSSYTQGSATGGFNGGQGGYSTGVIEVANPLSSFILVGGQGGFNGGGINSFPGGGSTDIRLLNNNLYNRIIVAGGGGGSYGSSYGGSAKTANSRGYGGGSSGLKSTTDSWNGAYTGGGASQLSVGANGNSNCAGNSSGQGFGVGGLGESNANGGTGGGGGGWYGGAGGSCGMDGGGGSGYVLTSTSYRPSGYAFPVGSPYEMTNTQLLAGNQTMPAPSTYNGGSATQSGQVNNGYAVITAIAAPPSLTVSAEIINDSVPLNTLNYSGSSETSNETLRYKFELKNNESTSLSDASITATLPGALNCSWVSGPLANEQPTSTTIDAESTTTWTADCTAPRSYFYSKTATAGNTPSLSASASGSIDGATLNAIVNETTKPVQYYLVNPSISSESPVVVNDNGVENVVSVGKGARTWDISQNSTGSNIVVWVASDGKIYKNNVAMNAPTAPRFAKVATTRSNGAASLGVHAIDANGSYWYAESNSNNLTKSNLSEAVHSIETSYNGSVFLITTSGKLFAAGYNSTNYDLGNGLTAYINPLNPVQLNFPEPIKLVAAGDRGGYAVDTSNKLWSWGFENGLGRLADGYTAAHYNYTPKLANQPALNAGETIEQLTAANVNGSLLTSEGRVFQWGAAAGNTTNTLLSSPTLMTQAFPEKPLYINRGVNYQSYAIGASGKIMGWSGGTSNDPLFGVNYTPIFIPSLNNLLKNGERYTAVRFGMPSNNIGAAVTNFGRMITWGNTSSPWATTPVENPQVLALPVRPISASVNQWIDNGTAEKLRYQYTVTVPSNNTLPLNNLTPNMTAPEHTTCTWDKQSVATVSPGASATFYLDCEVSRSAYNGVGLYTTAPTIEASFNATANGEPITLTSSQTVTTLRENVNPGSMATASASLMNAAGIANNSDVAHDQFNSVSVSQGSAGNATAVWVGQDGKIYRAGTVMSASGNPTFIQVYSTQTNGVASMTVIAIDDQGDYWYSESGSGSLTKANFAEKVKTVATGYNGSVFILTTGGKLYAAGFNSGNYELGLGTGNTSYVPLNAPRQIDFGSNFIKLVAAGQYGGYAVDARNRLWSWGYENGWGRLANGVTTTQYLMKPTLATQPALNAGESIKQLTAASLNGSILTSEGRIFQWGNSGGNNPANLYATPTLMTGVMPETPLYINRGANYQTYAIGASGRIIGWTGVSGEDPMLTHGAAPAYMNSINQFLTSDEKFVQVEYGLPGGSYYQGAALTNRGRIVVWGNYTAANTDYSTTPREIFSTRVLPSIASTTTNYVNQAIGGTAQKSVRYSFTMSNRNVGNALTNVTATVNAPSGWTCSWVESTAPRTIYPSSASTWNYDCAPTAASFQSNSTYLERPPALTATFSGDSDTGGISGSVIATPTFYKMNNLLQPIVTAQPGVLMNAAGAEGHSVSNRNLQTVDVSQMQASRNDQLWINAEGRVYRGTTLLSSPAGVKFVQVAANRALDVPYFDSYAVSEAGDYYYALADSTTLVKGTLPAGEIVTKISAGYGNLIILTLSGKVYGTRLNTNGDLGIGTSSNVSGATPVQLNFAEGAFIKDVAANYYGGYAVDMENRLWSWGYDAGWGRLADGIITTHYSYVPKLAIQPALNNGETIKQVAANSYNGSILTSEGRIFQWGAPAGNNGNTTLPVPTLMTAQLPETPAFIVRGSMYQTYAIGESGRIMSWGGGSSNDPLTPGNIAPAYITALNNQLEDGERFTSVSFGRTNRYIGAAVTDRGRIITWGNTSSPYSSTPIDFQSFYSINEKAKTGQNLHWNETESPIIRYVYEITNPATSSPLSNVSGSFQNPANWSCEWVGSHENLTVMLAETINLTLDCSPPRAYFDGSYYSQVDSPTVTINATGPGGPLDEVSATSVNLMNRTATVNALSSIVRSKTSDSSNISGNSTTSWTNAQTISIVPAPNAGNQQLAWIANDGRIYKHGTVMIATGAPAFVSVVGARTPTANNWSIYAVDANGDYWYALANSNTLTKGTGIPDKVRKIVTGSQGSIFYLTTTGRLYASGFNSNFELGIGSTTVPTPAAPTEVLFDGSLIKDVAAFYYGGLAIDSNNRLWTWGPDPSWGMHGDGITSARTFQKPALSSPLTLNATEHVRLIDANYANAIILTTSGRLFEWGVAAGNSTKTLINKPTEMTASWPENPIYITRGSYYQTYAISESGKMMAWSGNSTSDPAVPSGPNGPQFVTTLNNQLETGEKFIQLSYGLPQNYGQGAALTDRGRIIVWGSYTAVNYDYSTIPREYLRSNSISASPSLGGNTIQLARNGDLQEKQIFEVTVSNDIHGSTVTGVIPTLPEVAGWTSEWLDTELERTLAPGESSTWTARLTPSEAIFGQSTLFTQLPKPDFVTVGTSDTGGVTVTGSAMHNLYNENLTLSMRATLNGVPQLLNANGVEGMKNLGSNALSVLAAPNGMTYDTVSNSSTSYNVWIDSLGKLRKNNVLFTTGSETPFFTQVDTSQNRSTIAIDSTGAVWFASGDSTSLTKITAITEQVRQVVASETDAYFMVTTSGKVYAAGRNGSNYILGIGTTAAVSITSPVLMDFNGASIYMVSASANSGHAVDTQNRVWSWGNGDSGALGNGLAAGIAQKPIIIESPALNAGETFVQITSEYVNTNLLTSSGRLFQWGHSSGNWPRSQYNSPTLMTTLPEVPVYINKAARGTNYAIGTSGKIMGWTSSGLTYSDGLVAPNVAPAYIVAVNNMLQPDEKFTAVDSGTKRSYIGANYYATHSMAVTDRGRIITWGSNNATAPFAATPVDVTSTWGLTDMAMSSGNLDWTEGPHKSAVQYYYRLSNATSSLPLTGVKVTINEEIPAGFNCDWGRDVNSMTLQPGEVSDLTLTCTPTRDGYISEIFYSVIPAFSIKIDAESSLDSITPENSPKSIVPFQKTNIVNSVNTSGNVHIDNTGGVSGNTSVSGEQTNTVSVTQAGSSGQYTVWIGQDGKVYKNTIAMTATAAPAFVSVAAGRTNGGTSISVHAVDINGAYWYAESNSNTLIKNTTPMDRIKTVEVGYQGAVYLLTTTGKLYAAGLNSSYELGLGYSSNVPVSTPKQVDFGNASIKLVTAGQYGGYAIDTQNRLWSWGFENGWGRLADGLVTNHTFRTPKLATQPALSAGETITQITAKNVNGSILTSSNRIFQWGAASANNGNIRYAVPTLMTSALPETPIYLTRGSDNQSYAIGASGKIMGWTGGSNNDPIVSTNTTPGYVNTLNLQLRPGEKFQQLSYGVGNSYYQGAALTDAGRIISWGSYTTANTDYSTTPREFQGSNNTTTLALGGNHISYGTSPQETLKYSYTISNSASSEALNNVLLTAVAPAKWTCTWTDNTARSIAPGSTSTWYYNCVPNETTMRGYASPYSNPPTIVATYTGLRAGETVTAPITAKPSFYQQNATIALNGLITPGVVKNANGEANVVSVSPHNASTVSYSQITSGANRLVWVGVDGKVYKINVAMTATGAPAFTQVATSNFNATTALNVYAVDINGALWVAENNSNTLVKVTALTDPVRQIVGGKGNVLILTSTGKVYGAGYNTEYQLGDRTTTAVPFTSPKLLEIPALVKTIAMSEFTGVAVDVNNKIWTWGNDSGRGMLADGITEARTFYTPTRTNSIPLNNGESIVQVTAAFGNASILTSEGRIFQWGLAAGNHSNMQLNTPTLMAAALPEKPLYITRGSNNQTYAIGASGRIMAWSGGTNNDPTFSGNIAPAYIVSVNDQLYDGERFVNVAFGKPSNYTGAAVTDTGRIISWGNTSAPYYSAPQEFAWSYPTMPRALSGSSLHWNDTNEVVEYTVTLNNRSGYAVSSLKPTVPALDNWTCVWNEDLTNGVSLAIDGTKTLTLTCTPSKAAYSGSAYFKVPSMAITWNGTSLAGAVTMNTTTANYMTLTHLREGNQVSTSSNILNTSGVAGTTGASPDDFNIVGITAERSGGYRPVWIGQDAKVYRNNVAMLATNSPGFVDVAVSQTNGATSLSVYALDNRGYYWYATNNTNTLTRSTFVKEPIRRVIAGNAGSVFLISASGKVYAAGFNTNYELGLGGTGYVNVGQPRLVDFPGASITMLNAGTYGGHAVDTEGRVWAWGLNSNSRLGVSGAGTYTTPQQLAPLPLNANESITQITENYFNTSILTSSGRVFQWGHSSGNLGGATLIVPTLITAAFPETPRYITRGSYYQTYAIGDSGRIMAWGNSSNDPLVGGSIAYIPALNNYLFNDEKFIQLSYGKPHTYYQGIAVTDRGRIVQWGNYGTIGTDYSTTPRLTNNIVPVTNSNVTTANALSWKEGPGLTPEKSVYTYTVENSVIASTLRNVTPTSFTTPEDWTCTAGDTTPVDIKAGSSHTWTYTCEPARVVFTQGIGFMQKPPTIEAVFAGDNYNSQKSITPDYWQRNITAGVNVLGTSTSILNEDGASGNTITPNPGQSMATSQYQTNNGGSANTVWLGRNGQVFKNGTQMTTASEATTFVQVASSADKDATLYGYVNAYAIDDLGNFWYAENNSNILTRNTSLPEPIASMATGRRGAVYLVTTSGNVYSAGTNSSYELGIGNTTTYGYDNPQLMNFGESTIKSVSGGTTSGHAVDTDNRIWAWGAGTNNIGDGNSATHALITPTLISQPALDQGESIMKIVEAYTNVAILTSSGRIFQWGDAHGNYGGVNIAVPTVINRSVFASIEVPLDIFKGAVSQTYAVGASGKIYAWSGSSSFDSQVSTNSAPQYLASVNNLLQAGESVTNVSFTIGSWSFGAASTDHGRLITWGNTSGYYSTTPQVANTAGGNAFGTNNRPALPEGGYLNWQEASPHKEGVRYSYTVGSVDNSVALPGVTPHVGQIPAGWTCNWTEGAVDIPEGGTHTWDLDCYPVKSIFNSSQGIMTVPADMEAYFTGVLEGDNYSVLATASPNFKQVNIFYDAAIVQTMTSVPSPATLGAPVTITTTITNGGTTSLAVNADDLVHSIFNDDSGSNRVTVSNQADTSKLVLELGQTGVFTTTFNIDGTLLRTSPLVNTTDVIGTPWDCGQSTGSCDEFLLGKATSSMTVTPTGIDFTAPVTFNPSDGWRAGTTVTATATLRNIGTTILNGVTLVDTTSGFTFTCPSTNVGANGTVTCTSNPRVIQPEETMAGIMELTFNASAKLTTCTTDCPVVNGRSLSTLDVEVYTVDGNVEAVAVVRHLGAEVTELMLEDEYELTVTGVNSGSSDWTGVGARNLHGMDFECRLNDSEGAIISESTVVPAGSTVWCYGVMAAGETMTLNPMRDRVYLDFTPTLGEPMSFESSEIVIATIAAQRGIEISKPVVSSSDIEIPEGDTITRRTVVKFDYTVTNTGEITIRNLKVRTNDNILVTCESTTIAPNQSTVCSGSRNF